MIDKCGIKSVENIIYNGIDLSDRYTDHDKGTYLIVNSVYGRGLSAVEIHPSTAPFFDGSRIHWSRMLERIISVKITMKGESIPDLREKITDLAMVLTSDRDVEIQFSDEPHLVYYGRFNGFTNEFEVSSKTQIEFEIICGDPYKYSKKEKEFEINDDVIVVENEGNESTAPIIELTAHKPTTYAMIENGVDEYNLVGFPLEEGNDEVVKEKELIFSEDGRTFNKWMNQPAILDTNFSVANGSLIGDPTGIYADNYGKSSDKNHGGYKIQELPQSLTDFRLETHIDVDTPGVGETFRIEVYMIADDFSIIGKVGMLDGSASLKKRVGLARAGDYVGHGKNYTHYSGNYSHDRVGDSQTWYLRFIREGNQIRTRIARRLRGEQVRGKNGRISVKNIPNAKKPLRYIGVYIGYYKNTKRPRLARINHVDVYKLNKIKDGQTPYILDAGDTITFDHVNEDILINGENAMRLKNFGVGNSFWQLLRGHNSVSISPPDTFTGKIKFREKYK